MPKGIYPRKPPEERFWSKVDKRGPDECWPWLAGKTDGYGRFNPTHEKAVRAHRMAYELVKGPIPPGLNVLHDCDNPPCCNPTHLWAGTDLDNKRDAAAKSRNARGERHGSRTHPERIARGERQGAYTHPESRQRGERNGSAKLTEAQVREIRRLYMEGQTHVVISRLMGVGPSNIGMVVRRETWKHI